MGKLPAFLFYPKDWKEDPALQMCSREARSVWIDMLCLMFNAPIRGVCQSGGRPWTHQEIASAIGGDIGSNVACITELVSKAVAAVNDCGAIFSRRMVRDEQARKLDRERLKRWRDLQKPAGISSVKLTPETPVVTVDVTPLKRRASGTANVTTIVSKIPTIEEVSSYCAERKNAVRPEAFFNYYQTNGWKVGRNPMKDWRAAVRYWETRESDSNHHSSQPLQGSLLPASAYRACGKNGCVDGWVVTQNGKVVRCQCFEEYKQSRKQV